LNPRSKSGSPVGVGQCLLMAGCRQPPRSPVRRLSNAQRAFQAFDIK
jgi:hypothetical protein